MINVVPHRPSWGAEFQEIAAALRAGIGEMALRVDHSGSTSVPRLCAKDVIDLQVTVAKLDKGIAERLRVHVRQSGRLNQRYALLFRDYLVAHPPAAAAPQ